MNRPDGTIIRPVELRDLPFTRRSRSNRDLRVDTLGRPFPITELNEQMWFESLGKGSFPSQVVWIVEDASGESVGLVQLTEIHWIHRTAKFGLWIAPDHRGQKHATHALEYACDFGFLDLGLRQIRLDVLDTNTRAIALYQKQGFEHEATFRNAVFVSGSLANIIHMVVHCPSERLSSEDDLKAKKAL